MSRARIEALARAWRAVQAKLDYPVSRDNLSALLMRIGRYDDAIEQSEASLKIRSDDGMALQNLAVAYYLKGMFAESWKCIHRARAVNFPVRAEFCRYTRIEDARSAK